MIFGAVWVGKFLDAMTRHFCEESGFDRFAAGVGLADKNTIPLSAVLGKLVSVALILLAVIAACDILHFSNLAKLLRSFAHFGGNILLSTVVIFIGLWLAKLAAGLMEGKCNKFWISFVRICVIIFTITLAIRNIQIGDSIIEITFALLLGAFCTAGAIAFGIGGREAAAKLLEVWLEDICRKKEK
jgi:hypothetical protein